MDNAYILFSGWTQSAGSHFLALKETEDSEITNCLLLNNSNDTITYTIPRSIITQDSQIKLKISFDSFVQTRINDVAGAADNTYDGENIYSVETNGVNISKVTPVYQYSIITSIECGGQYWDDTNKKWTGTTSQFNVSIRQDGVSDAQFAADPTKSKVENQWVTGSKTIPITGITGGSLIFKVYCSLDIYHINYDTSKTGYVNNIPFRRVLIKNVNLEFVDSTGTVISNNGVLKKATSSDNVLYKNDTYEIKTTSGSGQYGVSKGSFILKSINQIVNVSDNLLLESFCTQYKIPRRKISANLNVKNYLLDIWMKLIADNKYQTGKAFYIVSSTYIDDQESMQVEMVEIISTRDSIV